MPPPTLNSPIPSGSTAATLVAFFSRALSAFQHSASPFQVICTLNPTSPTPTPPTATTPSPPTRPKTLIILDSSFNPPTLAHLHMATSALRAHQSSSSPRLLLLLSVQNADKPVKPAGFAERLAMMHVFAGDVQAVLRGEGGSGEGEVEGVEGVTVDIGLTSKPYFHDKSRVITESGVYADDLEQVVLVGFDTLVRIFDAKYYGGEEGMGREVGGFLGRARLRVMMRPGGGWGDVGGQRGWVEGLEERWKGRVELVEGDGGMVSSTLAREAVRVGDWEVVGGLVTEGVRAVIRDMGVYGPEE